MGPSKLVPVAHPLLPAAVEPDHVQVGDEDVVAILLDRLDVEEDDVGLIVAADAADVGEDGVLRRVESSDEESAKPETDHQQQCLVVRPIEIGQALAFYVRKRPREKAPHRAAQKPCRQGQKQQGRRRADGEVEKARKFALERFAGELLPVIDNLERGLQMADTENEAIKPMVEGVEMTLKSVHSFFPISLNFTRYSGSVKEPESVMLVSWK